MANINIFIIDGSEARKNLRKGLKKFMPKNLRESFDQAGVDVDMESGEEMRENLPEGLPREFVVPEEVLVFPAEKGDSETTKKRRRRMRDINNRLKSKKTPGNPG